MLTRRAVLTGTAAASIAAIASSKGVSAAEQSGAAFGEGYGNLADGAIGAFYKATDGFTVFLKWDMASAEVFYKEQPQGVEVFYKSFFKEWSPVTRFFLKADTLSTAVAAFQKMDAQAAEFFIKIDQQTGVLTSFDSSDGDVQINIEEVSIGEIL